VFAWLSVWSEVQTCIWPSWCHCHSLSVAPVKSRLVLPFWYRLTQVVLEKRPLNGCSVVYNYVQTWCHEYSTHPLQSSKPRLWRLKSRPLSPLASNSYSYLPFIANLKAACGLCFSWAATSSCLGSCASMTSSIKLDVHNLSQHLQRRTEPQP